MSDILILAFAIPILMIVTLFSIFGHRVTSAVGLILAKLCWFVLMVFTKSSIWNLFVVKLRLWII